MLRLGGAILPDGRYFYPFSINNPVNIVDANTETANTLGGERLHTGRKLLPSDVHDRNERSRAGCDALQRLGRRCRSGS